jgi:diguanylate cyclase (GGDEF)-like protein
MADNVSNVLIVDDDPDVRGMLVDVLSESGRCVACASGDEALERMAGQVFDVVVLDIVMPGLDGLDLLERINRRNDPPKVVLVSGNAPRDSLRRALRGGAFDILQKPLDLEELRRVVAEATAARRRSGGRVAECRDALTGTLDHRAFLEAVNRSSGLCRRRNEPLSLLLLDLVRFREINESHSHAIGDRVLAWVGALLKRLCRDGDIVSRYSWDRFAAALPGSTETQACEIAERCKERLFGQPLRVGGVTVAVTASFGVAELSPGFVESPRDLIDRAEQALAAAKRAGGRRIVGYSDVADGTVSRRRLDQASVEMVSQWIGALRQQLRTAYLESTRALVGAVEAKDPHTRQHSLRVSDATVELARRLDLSAGRIESARTAAILHDIGKIGVPDAVLQKPGPLTTDEFGLIQQHPQTALQILGRASFLSAELPIILHHHERYDGRGYPAGLAGEQIPFAARILAVADSLDAMSAERSYKSRYSLERIREELGACAGSQWDPTVVKAANDWLDSCPDALSADDNPTNTLPPPLRLVDGRLRWFAEPAHTSVGGSVRRTELHRP